MVKECRYKDHAGDRLVPLELMTKDKYRKDGYGELCLKCGYKRKKAYIDRVRSGEDGLQSNDSLKATARKRSKKYKLQKGFAVSLFTAAKSRAKKKCLEFTISIDDIIIPELCPVYGTKLETDMAVLGSKVGINNLPDNYPTIDRLNSKCGYTPDNICIISWKANRLKSNATVTDLKKLAEWLQAVSIRKSLGFPLTD